MFTHFYNGAYINGHCAKSDCYVTDDSGHFRGIVFKSYRAAQIAITKARKAGLTASR
jgi:hypothetical protein